MNNDLISREALKDIIEYNQSINPKLSVYDVLKIIDNAPTITPSEIQAIMSDYLVYRSEPERPHGEWILDKENSFTIDMFRCSICGGFGATHFDYCPKCGADMRGDEE